MHCMDVHKTKVTSPRPRRYIFKTETRPRRWTLKTEMRPRRSIFPNFRDRDETETFNLQDRDETRRSKKRLETVTRPRRSRPRLHPCQLLSAHLARYCCELVFYRTWRCMVLTAESSQWGDQATGTRLQCSRRRSVNLSPLLVLYFTFLYNT